MFKVGEWVTVAIGMGEQTAKNVMKYNGRSFKVKTRFSDKWSHHTYQLVGCVSERGVHYTFCEDWLMPSE